MTMTSTMTVVPATGTASGTLEGGEGASFGVGRDHGDGGEPAARAAVRQTPLPQVARPPGHLQHLLAEPDDRADRRAGHAVSSSNSRSAACSTVSRDSTRPRGSPTARDRHPRTRIEPHEQEPIVAVEGYRPSRVLGSRIAPSSWLSPQHGRRGGSRAAGGHLLRAPVDIGPAGRFGEPPRHRSRQLPETGDLETRDASRLPRSRGAIRGTNCRSPEATGTPECTESAAQRTQEGGAQGPHRPPEAGAQVRILPGAHT